MQGERPGGLAWLQGLRARPLSHPARSASPPCGGWTREAGAELPNLLLLWAVMRVGSIRGVKTLFLAEKLHQKQTLQTPTSAHDTDTPKPLGLFWEGGPMPRPSGPLCR